MSLRNVLLTGASRSVPLVNAFRRALRRTGGELITADHERHALVLGTPVRHYAVAAPDDPSYIDEIFAVAQAEGVGLVVPTSDADLHAFARVASRFAVSGIRVAISPAATIAICHDKYQTVRTLAQHDVRVTQSYLRRDLPAKPTFPLLVKSRCGTSGRGTYVARDADDLAFFLNSVPDPLLQPYGDGPELAVDVVCDFANDAVSVAPRVDADRSILSLAGRCTEVLPFAGAVTVLFCSIAGRPAVSEIIPRFAEGFPPSTADAAADLLVGLDWNGWR